MSRYAQEFDRSLSDPEGFWADAAKNIDWYQAPSVVLDASNPPFYRWFADGVLNTCFNAVDRHVRDGRGSAWLVPRGGASESVLPAGQRRRSRPARARSRALVRRSPRARAGQDLLGSPLRRCLPGRGHPAPRQGAPAIVIVTPAIRTVRSPC